MSRASQRRARERVRTAADAKPTHDSFQNLQARLGAGSGNVADASTYALTNLITRQPRTLEFMYRGSWIVKAAVDAVADDMCREGIDFGASLDPEVTSALSKEMQTLQLWTGVANTIRWGRLYGGAIGVMLIDGQDMSTPLNQNTIRKGQFKGILPIDRWSLNQGVTDTVTEFGPHLGKPSSYMIGPNAPALRGKRIHYSRVLRVEGVPLPWTQRLAEQNWGLSIIEPMYDRLLAFDSTTTGAAQLVFKAYLRVMKVDGLRQILAAGGPAIEALAKQVEAIRQFQTTEGLTLIDAKDEMEFASYTFSGLDSVLMQFGQQLSGATGIPLVRLFGQSPAGLNSTGDGDIRNYYDAVKSKQEADLRTPLTTMLDVLHRSVTGEATPDSFSFSFNPLWQMSDSEKATTAKTIAETVAGAYEADIIDRPTAMKELKQSADITGIFTNITDDLIRDAENEPPAPAETEDDGTDGPANGNDPAPGPVVPPVQLRQVAGGAQ